MHVRFNWTRVTAVLLVLMLALTACGGSAPHAQPTAHDDVEAVVIEALPLPPTAPSPEPGSCSSAVNPRMTGCLDTGRDGVFGTKSFTWDGNHVLVAATLAGAPSAPSPSSIYTGPQLLLVKTDTTTFANGDAWKCLTCGVPQSNKVGINDPGDVTYPEAFRDERRVKMGNNILDCGPHRLIDDACTPAQTHIFPIRSPFPPAPEGGVMRETRLHPDGVHLGWNQLFITPTGAVNEYGAFGRLRFQSNPPAGPPSYVLDHVSFLLSPDLSLSGRFVSVERPGVLRLDPPAGVIGEFRGFTSDGTAALGIGAQESFNMDIFATGLSTGMSRRLSNDPAYTDPVSSSPDDTSIVIMDGRVDNTTNQPGGPSTGESGRMYFASALPGVPPLIDLAITGALGGLYSNPGRGGFFQPYLINIAEGEKTGSGQQLNAGGNPTPGSGSISDPLWNAGADPAWSPDGTSVVYYQRMVAPPGCGSPTPPEPACVASTEPGGRQSRLMIARLTDRQPAPTPPAPSTAADDIPWGIAWKPGDPIPARPHPPAGKYILPGRTGVAEVEITAHTSPFTSAATDIVAVAVRYRDYSFDGTVTVNGTESGSVTHQPSVYTWHSDLTVSGQYSGSRSSSEPGGFTVTTGSRLGASPTISGTLTTTVDGRAYNSPVNGS